MKKEIGRYLQAGLPLIAVNTVEVARAVATIHQALEEFNERLSAMPKAHDSLKERGFKVFSWDVNSGYADRKTAASLTGVVGAGVLARAYADDTPSGSIFILQNFNLFLERGEPRLIQELIDFVEKKKPHVTVFIVGCIGKFPAEINNLFSWIDFELPSREELNQEAVRIGLSLRAPLEDKQYRDIADAAAGMTLREAEHAFRTGVVITNGHSIDRDHVLTEKSKAVKQAGLLEFMSPSDTLDHVGGLKHLKDHFMKISNIFHNREEAEKYGIRIPKGSLVFGVPGTGKSLIARAIANLFRLPLYSFDVGRLMEERVGSSEKNTRLVFKQIASVAPAVVRIEEIEKSLTGAERGNDAGVGNRILQRLLVELQEGTAPVYYVATANDVHLLPPALVRRLDPWFVDLPSDEERMEIFTIHLKKVGRNPAKFKLKQLVKESDGFIGSEVENCIVEAMFTAFYDKKREFTTEDILTVIKSMPLLAKTKEEEVRRLRAWAKGKARIANVADSLTHPAWYNDTPIIMEGEKPQ